jgi:archaellum component FlaC
MNQEISNLKEDTWERNTTMNSLNYDLEDLLKKFSKFSSAFNSLNDENQNLKTIFLTSMKLLKPKKRINGN